MKKQIVITLAALALLTTACGHDASFKTNPILNADDAGNVTPQAVADLSTEQKAEVIVTDDVNVSTSKNTDLSAVLGQEILGVSLTISKEMGEKDDGRPVAVDTAKLTIASFKNNECLLEEKSIKSFKLSDAFQNFINITDGGRFRCLEEACDNILLILERGRNIRVTAENGKKKSEYQFGNLSVVLKKAADGVYKPVSTESTAFAQIQDSRMGELTCNDKFSSVGYENAQNKKVGVEETVVVTTPTTPAAELSNSDRVRAYQQAQIAKAKAAKTPVATISISERLRTYQEAQLTKAKAAKDAAAGTSHQVIIPTAE